MTTIRCSSLDRVFACPGSLTLCNIVAPRRGQDGDEGTALHWLAHSRMKLEMGAAGEIGECPVIPKAVGFSAWIVDFYVRTVRDFIPADWSLEVEVGLSYEFAGFTLSGHIDCLGMSPDGTEAILFDLKTGRDPVDPADNNEQMFGYGCVLLKAYPDLQKITGYIVQPRNDEDQGDQRISPPMVLEGSTLAQSIPVMERRMADVLANLMEVTSGRKQCRWCQAAIQCPAVIGERELMKMKLTDESLARIREMPDDATLADWMIATKILRQPSEDADTLGKERIKLTGGITATDGTLISCKTGPGAYKYPQPVEFFRALRVLVPDDDKLAPALSFSMTKARDVIAEVHGLPKTARQGASADALVTAHLKPLAEQGERVTLIFSP